MQSQYSLEHYGAYNLLVVYYCVVVCSIEIVVTVECILAETYLRIWPTPAVYFSENGSQIFALHQ